MADDTCPLCNAAVDEQAILCPNCGKALIPQKTKTELSHEADNFIRGRRRVIGAVAAGFGLAAIAALVWRLTQPGAEFSSAGFLLLMAFALFAILPGLFLASWFYRSRTRSKAPGVKPADAEIEEAPPTADEQAAVIRERQHGPPREWDGGNEELKVD
jgi:hypothetical protein